MKDEKLKEAKQDVYKINTALWDRVFETNPDSTNPAQISGRTVTTIDAYAQIHKATQEWGSYGKDWGLFDLEYDFINLPKDQIMAFCKGVFKYPDGCFPLSAAGFAARITNRGYLSIDDDFSKKIETDMMTKALSRLGFNADVFMGKFSDSKYVEEMDEKFGNEPKKAAPKAAPKATPKPKPKWGEKQRDQALKSKVKLDEVMLHFELTPEQQKEYTELLNLPI